MLFSTIHATEIVDSVKIDTATIADTNFVDTLLFDTTGIDVDTLTEAQKVYQQFLYKQAARKEEQEKEVRVVKTYLSFYDSLVTTFLHPRLNSSTEITRSFAKDAGDYFRTDPSYFVQDNQQTPQRKTVSPFGLSGNRMNVVVNGLTYSPFAHIPQPDGMMDFNDIPTGLTKDIYILPGAVGMLFGGEQAIATLVTVPNQPTTLEPEIKLHVDKGSYDYAYTRGGYTKLFSDGKEVDLSVDYRNSSGLRFFTEDNSKHFAGRVLIPLKPSYYLTASGSSYRRKGLYKPVLSESASFVARNRIDKNGKIAIEKFNDAQTVKYHLGYQYITQNTNLDFVYKGRFNIIGDDLSLQRESQHGNRLFKSEISYATLEQTDGFTEHSQKSGMTSLSMIQKNQQSSLGLKAGLSYNNDSQVLPSASIVYQKYTENNLMLLSLGYAKKAVLLHDQNLSLQPANMYSSSIDYADMGNSSLQPEKQLVGSFLYEYGSMQNNIRFTFTGGMINDGIDWYHTDTVIELISLKLFRPYNSDIQFADFQVKQKLTLSELLSLSAGGAYHFIDYKRTETRPFQPEYQFFVGGELHQYWKQKLIDLYFYGEAVYSGVYTDYFYNILGENIVINTGMAFQLKKFRFYYIFQNSFNISRPHPDAFTNSGQFSYYGFTWYFIN